MKSLIHKRIHAMRTISSLFLALIMAVPLAGCGTTRDDRAVNGALLGGAAGAVVGGLASGRAGGALAGGAIGAAAGAIIGAETTPTRRCVRWGYDYDGNRICLRSVRVN
jgi:osmotically inducible lipoprotein OsmB